MKKSFITSGPGNIDALADEQKLEALLESLDKTCLQIIKPNKPTKLIINSADDFQTGIGIR